MIGHSRPAEQRHRVIVSTANLKGWVAVCACGERCTPVDDPAATITEALADYQAHVRWVDR